MESLLEYWYISLSLPLTYLIIWIGKIILFKLECNDKYKMIKTLKKMNNEEVVIISKALKDNYKDDDIGFPKISDIIG